MNPDQQRQPIGGHHFPEENGPMIRGDTFQEVVKKLVAFRTNNGKILGNPSEEILLYYAKNYPYTVMQGEDKPREEKPKDYLRYAHWIRTVWQNPPKKLLTRKEASMRWDICLTCPANKKKNWQDDDEAKELGRRAFMLRCGLDIPPLLGFCDGHRWPNEVAVFLEAPVNFSAKPKEITQESRCWV